MYTQPITRSHRTAFVLLIDRSGSMAEPLPGEASHSKAEGVCEIVNTLLFELVERARRIDGVRDYYDVAVIGYSGRGTEPLLGEEWLLPIPRLLQLEPKIRDRWAKRPHPEGGEIVQRIRQMEWITPNAEGCTPLYEALCEVHHQLKAWCQHPAHRNSFPPVIFHITDGEASDADPESLKEISRRIRQLGTTDGEVLLFNCHLSSSSLTPSILFPSSPEALGENRYGRLLFEMSSPMPAPFEEGVRELTGRREEGPFRGMSFNCSPHEVMSLLNIGTISAPIQ